MNKILKIFFVVLIIFIVFYFSWIPNPNLVKSPFIPNFFAKYLDIYYNLRTGIPFIFLGLLMTKICSKKVTIISCVIIVVIAEFGQLFMPHRHADLMDVFYGIIGSLLGIYLNIAIKKISSFNI